MIYLDNAATTRPFDEVLRETENADKDFFANSSSMHSAGYLAEKKINAAAETALFSIGAKDGTFVFTSGGTESNNLAVWGTLQNAMKRKPHIITTKIEHPSVSEPIRFLENLGAEVTYIGTDTKGFVDPDEVAANVRENTKLVSVMYVNNETGAIQPIGEISKKAKKKNQSLLFHTDCVQAMGNADIDVRNLGADMLSLSAHKINGPKGVGGFYFSKNVHIKPMILGGHQQTDLRSGTLNTPGICGFAKALELTVRNMEKKRAHLADLKRKIIAQLSDSAAFSVNNAEGNYAPHIISIHVKNVRAEVLLHALETYEICISAGSACSSHKPAPSHVLTAMGYDKRKIEETIRVSTGTFSTEEEIDLFCSVLKKEAAALSKFTRM